MKLYQDPVHPFDLVALAKLANEGLTKLVDMERDGLPYFIGEWHANPPRAEHNFWDYGDGSGRLLDALTLCSIISPLENESLTSFEKIERWVLKQCQEDGLSWVPSEPWVKPWGDDALFIHAPISGGFCEVSWSQRGSLMGLLSRYLQTEEPKYLEAAKGIVDGLLSIAVKHVDGLYFPDVYYQKSGWQSENHDVDPVIVEYNAASLAGVVRLYELTNYEPALRLASGIVNFALKYTQGYDSLGNLVVPPGNLGAHFHTRSNFVLGILKFGLVQNRPDIVKWSENSFNQLLDKGTDFGWFPEGIGMRHGEICCTTDMIELALLLGRHVNRNYYSFAEKFGRNHLIESQWKSITKLRDAVEKLNQDLPFEKNTSNYVTTVDLISRQLGAFSSRPTLNDGFHTDATALMQCCNAAGARAIYDLWKYAIELKSGEIYPNIYIHLRFSINNALIQTISHEPAIGLLEAVGKMQCNVQLRLPEGTREAEISRQNEAYSKLYVENGYALFALQMNEKVQIKYDLSDRTEFYSVGSPEKQASISGTWRGETLISVEPKGSYYPLYGRDLGLNAVEVQQVSAKTIESI